MSRVEHCNGVRFRETCEEEEVRTLPEGVFYVIIANLLLPSWDDRNGVPELVHELRSTVVVACDVHAMSVQAGQCHEVREHLGETSISL
jgi:hypothetical protein